MWGFLLRAPQQPIGSRPSILDSTGWLSVTPTVLSGPGNCLHTHLGRRRTQGNPTSNCRRRQTCQPKGNRRSASCRAADRARSCGLHPCPTHSRQRQQQRRTACKATGKGQTTGDAPEPGGRAAESELKVLLLACAIGILTGAGVVLFNDVIKAIRHVAWQETPLEATHWGRWARQQPIRTAWHLIVLPPALGGCLVGAFTLATGNFGERWATNDPKSLGSRAQSLLQPLLKATSAALTLGTGASLGPEGPSVDIGRSVAGGLGNTLRSKQRRLQSLIAAGSGAGVAAGFNAPIAGVFFAVETVLQAGKEGPRAGGDSSGLTVAMVLLACVLSATVSQAGLGATPAIRVPPTYELQSLYELPLVLACGACCGLASAAFLSANEISTRAFKRLRKHQWQEAAFPAIGGLVTGISALGYPEVLYQGFGNVNAILQSTGSDYAPWLLLQIVGVKIVCTAICKGSGLTGGIYAPSIFIGAALGSSFGGLAHFLLMPLGISVTDPQAYALVGAAAMLAASCQVPLTAVLLLFELTRDYLIVVPTLGAVGLSYWLVSLPDLSLPTKLPFVGGPEDQLPLIWTGSTLQVRSFPELIGSLTLQPQQNQADSRSDVDRSPGSEVADAAPGVSNRPVRSTVQDTLEPVSFSVEVQRALGRAQRSAMLAAGGGALDREVDAVPQPTPLGTPHKAVLHKDSTSSQAEPVYREGSDPLIPDERARTAKLALQTGMNGAAASPDLQDPVTPAPLAQEAAPDTVESCMEDNCVILSVDTSMQEALQIMSDAGQKLAMITDASGRVIGALTLEQILKRMGRNAPSASSNGTGH